MQKSYLPKTPQKKSFQSLHAHEDYPLKELSPLMLTFFSSNYGKMTKLEMLHSPLPANKDLFAQLIASEVKNSTEDTFRNYEILEEESYELLE